MSVKHITTQIVRGLPYLEKELTRQLSLKSGSVWTTPVTYYVLFSGRCNLECSFCTIYKEKEPTLSEETLLRIITEARALSRRGFNISLSGGEPTLYKPIYKAIEWAQHLGVNIGLTTNALTMTRSNAQRIIALDPFNINVSLESVDPAINETLRPMAGGTRRTLDGITHLLYEKERCKARVSLIIKPTIMEQNYRSLPALVRHFGRQSKAQIHFQPFVGGKGDPHQVQDLPRLREVMDELIALQQDGYPIIGRRETFDGFTDYYAQPPDHLDLHYLDLGGVARNCDIGLRTMVILPGGDVFFCDFLGKPVGNVYQQSLSEIYYGRDANGQRQTMIHCNIDCQQTCKRPVPLSVKAQAFLRMG